MAEGRPTVRGFHHPGSGRRRATHVTKGRQATDAGRAAIGALLGERPRHGDLLIEYLHLIQDRYQALDADHLAALADALRLPLAAVYEVATFYAHFDVVRTPGAAPPRLTVRVCDSLSCELAGCQALLGALPATLGAAVRVVRAPCMGRCDLAPTVEVGHRHIDHASVEAVAAAVAGGTTAPDIPAHADFDAARRAGGYALYEACQRGERPVEQVLETLDAAGLRGMGGAGFPATRKWSFVRAEPGPRLLALNADEGEPGTFKDRLYLEREPHAVLEGALIAAWAVDASDIYIYLRDEYPAAREILLAEIAKLTAGGLTAGGLTAGGLAGLPRIHLRRGAGAYICGEESAMIESIEGKRGLPRHRPPYVAQVGLFGRPTLVHNVETVYWIPQILAQGAAWFANQGRRGHQGVRALSVSGRVRLPGVKVAPVGITARELIDELCGGMAPGHTFKGYLPGGASGGILPASMADLPLAFGTLEEYGCFVGSGAVVVLSTADDMAAVARNLLRFFEDESCGQCTPCRVGTEKAVQLMNRPVWDRALLDELSATMREASICGLGQAAPNPLDSVLRYFPDDVPK